MMNTPKPIDTHYNGYKFRSRLEARWAVFFDELQIPYAYESEGFDLGEFRYLPDFHLTNGLVLHEFKPTQLNKIWVEIKPDLSLEEDERQKIAQFVKQTDYHILLIAGHPDINVSLRFIDHHPETGWFVTDVRWIELPGGEIGLVPIEFLNNNELLSQTNAPRLRHALDKARQARFEFGQTPESHAQKEESPSEELPEKRWSEFETKKCRACGKEFKPYRSHFIYCPSCYHKQRKADLAEIGKPMHSNKRNVQSTKTRHTFGYLTPILVLSGLAISFWMVISLTTNGFFSMLAPPIPTAIPTLMIPATYTAVPTRTRTPVVTRNASICTCTRNVYDCADFSTQAEAQACFDLCFPKAGDIHFLDSNKDGEACETLP